MFEAFDPDRAHGLDLVFLGLPHEASMALAPQLVGQVGCVVDLSAAYRLKDPAQYPTYYGFEHDQPALLAEAVYGLPELHRDELEGRRLIATPGCYVTAATLAFGRSSRRGDRDARCDRRRRARRDRRRTQDRPRLPLHDRRRELHRLRAADHRHTPEMEQEIGAQLLFTPHLAPMNRGILATCYARPATGSSPTTDALLDLSASASRTSRSWS